MAAGIIGVPLGSGLVQYLRPRHSSQCDALVCASGLFVSAPFVYASLVVAKYSVHWCFVFMFVAEVALNMCWSIVADILLVSAATVWKLREVQCGRAAVGVYGVEICKSIPRIRLFVVFDNGMVLVLTENIYSISIGGAGLLTTSKPQ